MGKLSYKKWKSSASIVLSTCNSTVRGILMQHYKPASKPNIIYILADDMGYGDVSANNEGCPFVTLLSMHWPSTASGSPMLMQAPLSAPLHATVS